MFERALHEHELHAIRDATQFEWALAGEAFRQMAEALAGRRATRLPMGPRPRAPDG
jgi:uncharacterized protein with von Willebrand factor type A (vWA) domain